MFIFNRQSLFLLIVISAAAHSTIIQDNSLKNIVAKTEALKLEIETAFKEFQQKCNSTLDRDDEFRKIVQEFLGQNFTQSANMSGTSTTEKPASIMAKIKNKISSLVQHNETRTHPEARLKRCLTSNLELGDIQGAEVTIERETFNMTSKEVDEFGNFLMNFLRCLKIEARNETRNDKGEIDLTTVPSAGKFK